MAITPTPKSQNPFDVDLGAYQDAATRIREFNERLIDSSNAAGHTALKAYEETLSSFLDLEEKVAGATRMEWVSALAQTHAAFLRDVSAAYLQAARDLLSGRSDRTQL
jgi:hypothetical protein